jgi:hypothetical protein
MKYGWRTPMKNGKIDYAAWAELTRTDHSEPNLNWDNVPDRRDNRDAGQIGKAILSKQNSKPRNVHTKDSKEFLKNHPAVGGG